MFKKKLINWCEHKDFKKIAKRIEENELEIKYIDNSNLTHVQSGKIPLQKGWYLKEHDTKPESNIQTEYLVFKSILELFMYIGK